MVRRDGNDGGVGMVRRDGNDGGVGMVRRGETGMTGVWEW